MRAVYTNFLLVKFLLALYQVFLSHYEVHGY